MPRKSRIHSLEHREKEILRQQRRAFRRKFGREPGPTDPVFFDPDAPGDTPQELDPNKMRADVLEAMAKAGTPPEIAYAFAKTGYFVVDGLQDRFTPEALAEWNAAIAEYRRLEADGKLS